MHKSNILLLAFVTFAPLSTPAQPTVISELPGQIQPELGNVDFRPAFPAPFLPPLPDPSAKMQPVRLLGIDIIQDGNKLTATPHLNSVSPATLVTYWCANETTSLKLSLRLRFMGIRGRLSREVEASAGPDGQGQTWERGTLHRVEHVLDLPEIALNLSGRIDLIIGATAVGSGALAYTPLQSIAILIEPAIQQGKVPRANLEAKFGPNYVALDVSFRLGAGARQTVSIPEAWRGKVGRIGVISAFSFGPIAQDKPVCDVIAKRQDHDVDSWTMRSGSTTARTDIDFYPASEQDHAKVEIVESIDADYSDKSGSPFKRHRYLGWLEIEPGKTPLDAIEFVSTNDYVFDVFEVVLLPPAQP
ncbi:MAG: hypothetical protein IT366_16300 [Candidatus Hydrogenedentes bacterium]|nr:hypothetical protein [Candidatus Hydrogenedentota bacterium]